MRLSLAAAVALALALTSPSLALAQTLPEAPASSFAVQNAPSTRELLWPARTPSEALARPVLRRGRDMGLISVGIIGLSVGMIMGIAVASMDLAGSGNCQDFTRGFGTHVQCGTAALSLVPLAGTVLVGTVGFEGSMTNGGAELLGIFGLAPQLAGLIVLLVGMHGFTEDLGSRDDAGYVRIDPVLTPSQVGLHVSFSL